MTLRWNAEQFKQGLINEVANNAEAVGAFVRSQAINNLGAIDDPDWGQAYRSYVASLVSFNVEKGSREVIVTIGTKIGKNKWHGLYIELGSSRRPPSPWLRPAVFNNGQEIVSLFTGK